MAMSPRDKRALILFGSFAGVALLLYLFVLRGGQEPTGDAIPTTPPPTQVTETPRESPSPDDGIDVVGERNPFDPVIEPATGDGDGPSPSPTDGDGGSPQPTDSPTVSPAPEPTDGGTGGDSSETIGGHTVVLLSIFTQNGEPVAQVEVDGTVYIVNEGETFDDNFELLDISGDCATFRFGDERFTLCEQAPK